jgi:hypothetical protein
MTIFEDNIKALKSNTQALKILRKNTTTILLIYAEALCSIVLQLINGKHKIVFNQNKRTCS